jgi:hypothetical protein
MSVNVNIFNFNSNGIQPNFWEGVNTSALAGVNDLLSDIFSDFSPLFDSVANQFSGARSIAAGGCVVPPSPLERSQPAGSLKTDGSVITTAGGYRVEATGQFEWKITGPDGKTTRVWGDPHVAEGDGGKWDFKRNSTFVLSDGTRINVSTAPYGNDGMTVTSGLEIISGNDRVTVSGIDKGKGVVGQVTADGFAHSNTFGGSDVFVMGGETDDWSFRGREITGGGGGESFKLGNELAVGNTNGANLWAGNFDFDQLIHNFVDQLINDWNGAWQPNRFGANPYYNGLSSNSNNLWAGYDDDPWAGNNYDRPHHQQQLREAFRLFGQLFNVLARLSSLNDQMSAPRRSRAIYA